MLYVNDDTVKNKKSDPELFLLAIEQIKIVGGAPMLFRKLFISKTV